MTDLTKRKQSKDQAWWTAHCVCQCSFCGLDGPHGYCRGWLEAHAPNSSRHFSLVLPAEGWHRTPGSRLREKKKCVSVSVLVSTCLQPVKLFVWGFFHVSVNVHDSAHHAANTHGYFCSRSLFWYSLDSASLYMPEQLFVCGSWFGLYLIFKDAIPTLCVVFGVTGWVFTYSVKLP